MCQISYFLCVCEDVLHMSPSLRQGCEKLVHTVHKANNSMYFKRLTSHISVWVQRLANSLTRTTESRLWVSNPACRWMISTPRGPLRSHEEKTLQDAQNKSCQKFFSSTSTVLKFVLITRWLNNKLSKVPEAFSLYFLCGTACWWSWRMLHPCRSHLTGPEKTLCCSLSLEKLQKTYMWLILFPGLNKSLNQTWHEQQRSSLFKNLNLFFFNQGL